MTKTEIKATIKFQARGAYRSDWSLFIEGHDKTKLNGTMTWEPIGERVRGTKERRVRGWNVTAWSPIGRDLFHDPDGPGNDSGEARTVAKAKLRGLAQELAEEIAALDEVKRARREKEAEERRLVDERFAKTERVAGLLKASLPSLGVQASKHWGASKALVDVDELARLLGLEVHGD